MQTQPFVRVCFIEGNQKHPTSIQIIKPPPPPSPSWPDFLMASISTSSACSKEWKAPDKLDRVAPPKKKLMSLHPIHWCCLHREKGSCLRGTSRVECFFLLDSHLHIWYHIPIKNAQCVPQMDKDKLTPGHLLSTALHQSSSVPARQFEFGTEPTFSLDIDHLDTAHTTPIFSTILCFCLRFSHLYTLLPPKKNPQLLNGYIKSQAINLIKGSINQPIPNQTNSVAATTHSNDLHVIKKKKTYPHLIIILDVGSETAWKTKRFVGDTTWKVRSS